MNEGIPPDRASIRTQLGSVTMAISFKKGDVVQLKSNSPPMTVDDPDAPGKRIRCVWFAGAKYESAHFDPETLIMFKVSKEK